MMNDVFDAVVCCDVMCDVMYVFDVWCVVCDVMYDVFDTPHVCVVCDVMYDVFDAVVCQTHHTSHHTCDV